MLLSNVLINKYNTPIESINSIFTYNLKPDVKILIKDIIIKISGAVLTNMSRLFPQGILANGFNLPGNTKARKKVVKGNNEANIFTFL